MHPENVLVFGNNSHKSFKLIDFGWSCCFDSAKCGQQLSQTLPKCEANEALADDRFGLADLITDLNGKDYNGSSS